MSRLALALAATLSALVAAGCTPPETASRQETVSVTGTVLAIDPGSRRVAVEGDERTVVYRVSDEARNFEQVEVGDEITLDYYESVAVAMADPDDSGEPLTDVFGVRAPEGTRPGVAGGQITTFVVELVSYNPSTAVATVRLPDGRVTAVTVAEELRRFAATRQPGDRVLVLIEEAVALEVTPVA
jgi:hypothetical protein